MSYSHSIPPTVQVSRNQLVGLVLAVAALAAGVTGAFAAFAFDSDTKAASSAQTFTVPASAIGRLGSLAPTFPASDARAFRVPASAIARLGSLAGSSQSVTPWQLSGASLGTGYQLPSAQSSPTVASVLMSMSPETRRYTEQVMNLTFEQLAAGAAGHP
jgi:Tfp pilus assembly protein PilW